MAYIRANPLHFAQQKPIGVSPLPGVKHVASMVAGPMYSHLGHFGQMSNLMAGHNTNGSMHPGFAAVQNKIAAKEGVSKDAAGAILANASRHASAGAKKRNPRLNKVK